MDNRTVAAIGRLTCMFADARELRIQIRDARAALMGSGGPREAQQIMPEVEASLAGLHQTAADTVNDLAVLNRDPVD